LLIEIFYYFNGKITNAMLYGQGGVVKAKNFNWWFFIFNIYLLQLVVCLLSVSDTVKCV
jgi:hypothetical protein